MSPYKGKTKKIKVQVPKHNSQRIGPLLTTQVEELARKQKKRVDVAQTAYDPASILAQAVVSVHPVVQAFLVFKWNYRKARLSGTRC